MDPAAAAVPTRLRDEHHRQHSNDEFAGRNARSGHAALAASTKSKSSSSATNP